MRPYQLDVAVAAGSLLVPKTKALPIDSLYVGTRPDTTVKTLFLYNLGRMQAIYNPRFDSPATGIAITNIANQLDYQGSALLSNAAVQGVGLDMGGNNATFGIADNLAALYRQWDAAPNQPLYANEVARQIWYIVERAVTSYYPNVDNIVIVGGDTIIPFYRVPDQTAISNESDYYSQLLALPKNSFDGTSALGGSMFYRNIMTDNYYADRRPTAWNGRGLYVPDLAVGRLVERPEDMWSYIDSYTSSPLPAPYHVDAGYISKTDTSKNGSAMVTGYDFLSDEAAQISTRLESYGFAQTKATTHTLDVLNNNTWDAKALINLWVRSSAAAPTTVFGNDYTTQTPHSLMSINGHFTHYSAIPAAGADVLTAAQMYAPTRSATISAYQSYFKRTDMVGRSAASDGATLGWSVGCHSGLSATDEAFAADVPYRADFPQALIKQGGNWIGNTGFGYGDSDLIGYSEKLADLFTVAIGRPVFNPNDEYVGVPIGAALARAKREYVKATGVSAFSVYDEKVIAEATLYGFPFIRVSVPTPVAPSSQLIGSYDPPAQAVPDRITTPVFTRLITFTNDFLPTRAYGGDQVPSVSSKVEDSFKPGAGPLTIGAIDQTLLGRPVLPALSYDITLVDQNSAQGPTDRFVPRGVRLLSAATLPDLSDINPHVTTLVTDTTFPQQQDDPPMGLRGEWQPAVPYAYRTSAQSLPGGATVYSDSLVVNPAQFRADNEEVGTLRRFSRMVFEVSYVDGSNPASAALIADTTPPLISDISLSPTQTAARATTNDATAIRVQARVTDAGDTSRGDALSVTALYTLDGRTWRTTPLVAIGGEIYAATIPTGLYGQSVVAAIQARDSAGNSIIVSAKSQLSRAYTYYLPTASR